MQSEFSDQFQRASVFIQILKHNNKMFNKTKTIVCLTILTFGKVSFGDNSSAATNQYYASAYLQREFGSLSEYLSEREKVLSNPFFKGIKTTQSNSFDDNQGSFGKGDDEDERALADIKKNPFYQEFIRNTEIHSARPVLHQTPNGGNVRKSLLSEYDDSCGTLTMDRQPSIVHLIAYGKDASRHYPWLVAIFNATQRTPLFICGGTLISKNHMISAAHCLNALQPTDYQFLIANDLRSTEIVRYAKKIRNHSGYLTNSANADISVVFFNKEVPLGEHIKPICLWTDGYNNIHEITSRAQKGLVVGWGLNETHQKSESLPKEAFLPIIDFIDCIRSSKALADALGPQSFCAGYKEGTGPCAGDSGSGIIIQRNDRWYLRGIVSLTELRHKDICQIIEYTAATDVAKYSQWILSVIHEN